MFEKLNKCATRMQGNNEFTILVLVYWQVMLDLIHTNDRGSVVTIICQILGNVVKNATPSM